MARLFGIVLMLLAIWYCVSAYVGGDPADRAEAATPAEETRPERAASPAGQAAPTAITSRVRDRVNRAMAEGYHRDTGE